MLKIAVFRFFQAIPTLLILITLSFFLMHAAPGSPFTQEKNYPPEVIANINAKYGLNDPIFVQFLNYLKGLVHGNFGPSFIYKDLSVDQLITQSFPVSIQLGVVAFIIAATLGISMGIIAAIRQNTIIDYAIMSLAMIGVIMPSFVMAPLLVLVFAITYKIFPSGGWNGGAVEFMILPVISLSIGYVASISRLMRSSMIETLNSNFIRTAKAKGLSQFYIITRHTLKPAIIPVVTLLGPAFAGIITGSVVIETVFGIPGMGQLFVNGALNRDYSLVMSLTILVGTLTIFFNAIVDIAYTLLDPKMATR